ncbi:hypothetical protein [Halobacterium salinarum]|uniref:hypothetical protein n=1 Tax=Halobacterium salinarum TaxID=2242 RepID=UPI002553DC77|nr:hypothetical protein [Halobacterium salinarum]
MSLPDPIRNFNDGVQCYQDIIHSVGFHLNPITNPTRQEIKQRIERIDKAKEQTHNTAKIQKLNRLRNYLLEANYGHN